MPPRRHRSRAPSAVTPVHSGFKADFDSVYEQLQDLLAPSSADGETAEFSLIPLIVSCIRLVERVSKTSGDHGDAKLQLVMALLTRIIQDSSMKKTDKKSLQLVVESLGPQIISGLLDANNGKLFSSSLAGCKSFFSRFCCSK